MAVRLDPDLLERVDATQDFFGDSGRSSRIRGLLLRALSCRGGCCEHAVRAAELKALVAERGERIADLLAALDAIKMAALNKVLATSPPGAPEGSVPDEWLDPA